MFYLILICKYRNVANFKPRAMRLSKNGNEPLKTGIAQQKNATIMPSETGASIHSNGDIVLSADNRSNSDFRNLFLK